MAARNYAASSNEWVEAERVPPCEPVNPAEGRNEWFDLRPVDPTPSAAQGQDGFYASAGDPHGAGDIRCLLCGEQLVFDSFAHWHPTEDRVLARSEWWDKRP
jgi:hypothetical protein